MEKIIMNNWEIYNAENMIGDPEISEMEFYSTLPEDEKNSKVDDTSEETPVETNSEEEVEAKSTDTEAEESTTDEVVVVADKARNEIEMDPETAAKMAMQTKVVQATYTDIRNDLPEFHSGDTISVGYRVIEGSRSRIQSFDGVVIKISSGHGLDKTFTVRKISGGIGVERIFPFHSPNIKSINVLKEGKVRRAKLYYLRSRKGKATRIREKTQ